MINNINLDITYSYDRYYNTGLYEERYPRENRNMMSLIKSLIPGSGARILDFGCGTGRYSLPLLQETDCHLVGFDISSYAIQTLRARGAAAIAAGRLELMCDSLDTLSAAPIVKPGFDLILLMFGVLGHIGPRKERIRVLRSLAQLLTPRGKLVTTVPNIARRFYQEQKASRASVEAGELEPGDILYRRSAGAEQIDLYYHLYRPDELVRELTDAGLSVKTRFSESILPEKAVITSPLARWFDYGLARVVPLRYAYDFGVIGGKP